MDYYITRGANEVISVEVQIFCWKCYERVKQSGIYDYLQVFELKVTDKGTQRIEHRQEVPEYSRVYQLRVINPINQKIFIIEEGEYVTMLLAKEY